jgi:hypothetical protein
MLYLAFSWNGCSKEEEDPCANITCLNNGNCNNGMCDCAQGYEGTSCADEIRARYFGTYNIATSCSTGYTINIIAATQGINFVRILNFNNVNEAVFAQFNFSTPNVLEIPSQVVGNSSYSGTITYTSQFISANINYNRSGSFSQNCQGTITKQ